MKRKLCEVIVKYKRKTKNYDDEQSLSKIRILFGRPSGDTPDGIFHACDLVYYRCFREPCLRR